MDPKELRKRFEEKSSKTAAAAAEVKVEEESQKARQDRRAEEGRAAIQDVVVPYFQEIEATFPKGQFSFDSAVETDANGHSSLAVSFKIGNGTRYFIEVVRGNVKVFSKGPYIEPSKNGKTAPITYAQFVFASTAEPFIGGPRDLRREKLGKLVQIAIDQG